MGFNISGIVINKNYKSSLNELMQEFGWTLDMENPEEITFQEASANWKDEGICDIYFAENGTIIFAHHELCLEPKFVEGFDTANVLAFGLSETSMAFSFAYSEGPNLRRQFFQVDDNRYEGMEHGEPLPIEEDETDPSEIIWKQMGVVLGKRFWDVAANDIAYRYTFSKPG